MCPAARPSQWDDGFPVAILDRPFADRSATSKTTQTWPLERPPRANPQPGAAGLNFVRHLRGGTWEAGKKDPQK